MVEIDPIVIAAAGAAVIGLVALAAGACGGSSEKTPDAATIKENISNSNNSTTKKIEQSGSAEEKQKKKKSKNKKAEAAVAPAVSETIPVKTPSAPAPAVVVKQPEPVIATSKKSKKSKAAKDSKQGPAVNKAVQFSSSLEAASNDADEDDDSADESTHAEPDDNYEMERLLAKKKDMAITFDLPQSVDLSQVEDWALVGGNKKVKPKKPTTPTAAEAVPAPVKEAEASTEPPVVVDKVTSQLTVEAKKVGVIIGPKGVNKIAIQDALDVEITLPKSSKDSTEPVEVVVTGPAANVPKAIKAIQDLCTKGYSAVIEGEDFRETQVSVPPSFLPDIIGKNGAHIKAIQEKLSVRVVVPQQAGKDDKANVKIAVSGMKDSVIKTKALIKELMQYYHTEITHPGFVHIEMEVAPQYFNYIIGAKGSEIKHIQAFYKVQVHIPGADSTSKVILVVGLPQSVEAARLYILKIVDKVEQGRQAASDMTKGWINDNQRSASNEEKASDFSDGGSEPNSASSSPRSEGVWLEDLLIHAKRIPGSGIAGAKPGVSSAPGVAAAAPTAVAWSSALLTSNEGW